ncbi:MAG TPA: alanine--tRNA ligase [Candidatus Acidoferrum sp.]|nr:alanine--tRNA ligase [Candidatus Acidoferrum sp.]
MTVEAKTKFWSGNEVRETFLRFFESKGHRRVRSSSLVPHGDPTLLFTNAGMNQFKDVFLGLEKRDYNRATTAQKCVRAGGKHNDLENVGFTKRHHTFFEMMGNFSFGDYFKKEAIAYAWELVTSPEWYGIDKDKLYATVFGGAEVSPGTTLGVDDEAKNFWLAHVPADRVFEIPGLKDNFWAMGDTGPCGPCSEIFYDMGVAASEEGHTDCKFPCECGRYVEIWNLVFMQFNRDASGALTPLPKPCVDTGMGLERTTAVLQGVISNYDTDLFVPLLKRAAYLCRKDFETEEAIEQLKLGAASLRVIADHARATTFLIADGVLPSNEGRGYVLRKIMRRAIRHGRLMGADEPFLYEMVNSVRLVLGRAYPEILESEAPRLNDLVHAEEIGFARTLAIGSRKLDEEFAVLHQNKSRYEQLVITRLNGVLQGLSEDAFENERTKALSRMTFSGEKAFRLYDTYGLPTDFIQDAVRDAGFPLDMAGFQRAMEEQRTKARASWKGTHKEAANPAYAKIAETFKTEPAFYYATCAKDCCIDAIITKSGSVRELKAGESGEVVLDRTVIYAESGGQISDVGGFYDANQTQLLAEVSGAYYPVSGLVAHRATAKEDLHVGDRVTVVADAERRARVMRNHTGTHLVHAALRNILGTHVKQAGSLNAPDRLRFDFSHFAPVDAEELRDIEQQVNDEIRLNTELETNVTTLDDALASGALAFFGDKYPEHNVRVVTIPDARAPRGFYSKELCGGTHVKRIGDIGVLKIVKEESVAAGVRRIEAMTGIGALDHYQHQANVLASVAKQLNVGEDAVLAQVEKLTQAARSLEKQLTDQRRKGALNQLDELAAKAQSIKGTKVVVSEVENVDREALRQLVDSLRQKLGSGVVVLGQVVDAGGADDAPKKKVALIAGVTKDLTAKVHAGKMIQTLAQKVGGKGGGRPDLAEGGGEDTTALKSALSSIPSLLEPLL